MLIAKCDDKMCRNTTNYQEEKDNMDIPKNIFTTVSEYAELNQDDEIDKLVNCEVDTASATYGEANMSEVLKGRNVKYTFFGKLFYSFTRNVKKYYTRYQEAKNARRWARIVKAEKKAKDHKIAISRERLKYVFDRKPTARQLIAQGLKREKTTADADKVLDFKCCKNPAPGWSKWKDKLADLQSNKNAKNNQQTAV